MINANITTLLDDIKNFIKSKNPTLDIQTGSDLYDLIIHGNSFAIGEIYNQLQIIENLQSIATTTGSDLDRIARNYNLSRKSAIPATGEITLYASSITADTIIPAGTTVGTKSSASVTGINFKTVGDYNILLSSKAFYFNSNTGRYEITIPIQCVVDGIQGNVDANTITVLQSSVSQITGCVNYSQTSGGAEEETDRDLQERCSLSWVTSSVGTRDGYKKLMLDSEIVSDAFAVSPFDTDSVRDGVDIYTLTTSALTSKLQTSTYTSGDSYTILTSQPVISIQSIVTSGSWNMLEGVSWTFNKNTANAYSNSNVSSSEVARIDWIDPWSGTVNTGDGSAPYDTFVLDINSNITVFSANAYENCTIVFDAILSNNPSETKVISSSSYDSVSQKMTVTLSSGCTNPILAGDVFELNPNPIAAGSIDVNHTYLYNADIDTLQSYMDQSDMNVVGANALVKNGFPADFYLTLQIKLFSGFNFTTVKAKVLAALQQYISTFKFGDEIQKSDLVVVAQTGSGTDYNITEVDYVSINVGSTSTYLSKWDGTTLDFSSSDVISINNKDYVVAQTITITQI